MAAITPETVPETDLAAANTLRNTVDNVAIVAGPAIGAALLFAGPPSVAFAVNALSFVWSALVVSRMKVRSRPVDVTEGGQVGPLRQMAVGFRAIAASATATMLVAYSVIASFVYGVDTVQFVVLSEERLGTGASGFGYLLAGLGVGGVAAAGLVNRLAALPRLGTVILAGMAVYCLPTLLFLVVSAPPAAFAIEAVRGAGTLIVDVLAITALQRSLPSDVLARVFGAFFTLVLAAISLGALVTPQVIASAGLDASLWLAGLGIPALCLLGWPLLRRMDEANVAVTAALEPRVQTLQRLGIFAEASRPVLEQLARAAQEVDVDAGTTVIREGDEADALYVLLDGEMAVQRPRRVRRRPRAAADGRRHVLRRDRPAGADPADGHGHQRRPEPDAADRRRAVPDRADRRARVRVAAGRCPRPAVAHPPEPATRGHGATAAVSHGAGRDPPARRWRLAARPR